LGWTFPLLLGIVINWASFVGIILEINILHIRKFWGWGGEGPRSRCYGRTAALRLIVQPCDEDD
jgi:hypothetical protein